MSWITQALDSMARVQCLWQSSQHTGLWQLFFLESTPSYRQTLGPIDRIPGIPRSNKKNISFSKNLPVPSSYVPPFWRKTGGNTPLYSSRREIEGMGHSWADKPTPGWRALPSMNTECVRAPQQLSLYLQEMESEIKIFISCLDLGKGAKRNKWKVTFSEEEKMWTYLCF